MPTMLRPNKKAEKIVFAILGTPLNMQKTKKKNSKVEQRLVFEQTSRVR